MYLVEEAGSLLLEWGIINWCHIFVFKKKIETFNSTKHFSKSNIRNAFKKICPYQQPNKSLVNVNIACHPTGLHPPPFHAVLHLLYCCCEAKKGCLWTWLQFLFVVLAIKISVARLSFFKTMSQTVSTEIKIMRRSNNSSGGSFGRGGLFFKICVRSGGLYGRGANSRVAAYSII